MVWQSGGDLRPTDPLTLVNDDDFAAWKNCIWTSGTLYYEIIFDPGADLLFRRISTDIWTLPLLGYTTLQVPILFEDVISGSQTLYAQLCADPVAAFVELCL